MKYLKVHVCMKVTPKKQYTAKDTISQKSSCTKFQLMFKYFFFSLCWINIPSTSMHFFSLVTSVKWVKIPKWLQNWLKERCFALKLLFIHCSTCPLEPADWSINVRRTGIWNVFTYFVSIDPPGHGRHYFRTWCPCVRTSNRHKNKILPTTDTIREKNNLLDLF